ncbi:MAG: hypothetical protein ACYDH6_08650 [Acidimicrobiales bacterium]
MSDVEELEAEHQRLVIAAGDGDAEARAAVAGVEKRLERAREEQRRERARAGIVAAEQARRDEVEAERVAAVVQLRKLAILMDASERRLSAYTTVDVLLDQLGDALGEAQAATVEYHAASEGVGVAHARGVEEINLRMRVEAMTVPGVGLGDHASVAHWREGRQFLQLERDRQANLWRQVGALPTEEHFAGFEGQEVQA